MRLFALLGLVVLSGCDQFASKQTVTLYRTSIMGGGGRIHWATFDAVDRKDYNLGNCQMAARLLNANLIAAAKSEGVQPNPAFGFWCETGQYSEEGGVPIKFDAEFPTDSTGAM